MNKKDVKVHASAVADSIVKKGKVKPEKLEVNFLGIEKNEKGNFHSILLEIDIVVAGDGGKLNTLKNIQIPLSYIKDVVIDTVEKVKADNNPVVGTKTVPTPEQK